MDQDTQPVRLVTGKTDIDVAAEFKVRLSAKLLEVCAIMDEGKHAGLVFSFAIGLDWAGKNVISQLIAAKHF